MSCTNGGETQLRSLPHRTVDHGRITRVTTILGENLRDKSSSARRGRDHAGACLVRCTLVCSSGAYWILGSTCDILKTCRPGTDFHQGTGAHFHAEAHISTKPTQTREDPWISCADEDQERRSRFEPSPRHWPQACFCKRWLPRLSGGRMLVSPCARPFGPECVSAGAMSSSLRKQSPTLPISASSGRATPIQSATRTPIQSLSGARLQKHADYQRAYAHSRKRQSNLDELVSGAADNGIPARPISPQGRASVSRRARCSGKRMSATESNDACAKLCGAMLTCFRRDSI